MRGTKRVWRTPGKGILFFAVLSFLTASLCFGAEDPAQYPSRTITIICQWAAGGNFDLTGRKLGELASKTLGQPVVVEGKTGGGGVIGTTAVAKAAPDGYTLGTASFGPLTYAPHLRQVHYKTKEDFTFIMQFLDLTEIFAVRADSPWKTFKEFMEAVRSHPGKMSYSTGGQLSGQHVFMEQVWQAEKLKINHIPMSGGSENVTQLLGGHIDGAISSEVCPNVKSGKFRGLAIQSEKRSEQFPDVPTFAELGYKLDCIVWTGLYGPKGIDPRIVKKIFDAFKKAYDDPSYKELCGTLFVLPTFRDSDAFRKKIFSDYDSNAIVLKKLGIQQQK